MEFGLSEGIFPELTPFEITKQGINEVRKLKMKAVKMKAVKIRSTEILGLPHNGMADSDLNANQEINEVALILITKGIAVWSTNINLCCD